MRLTINPAAVIKFIFFFLLYIIFSLFLFSCKSTLEEAQDAIKDCQSLEECMSTYSEYAKNLKDNKTDLEKDYINRALEILEERNQSIKNSNDDPASKTNSLKNLLDEYDKNKPSLSNDYPIVNKFQQISANVYAKGLESATEFQECNDWLDRTITSLKNSSLRDELGSIADSCYYRKILDILKEKKRAIEQSKANAEQKLSALDLLKSEFQSNKISTSSHPSVKDEVEKFINTFDHEVKGAIGVQKWENRVSILREQLPNLMREYTDCETDYENSGVGYRPDIRPDASSTIFENESVKTQIYYVRIDENYKGWGGTCWKCIGECKWQVTLYKYSNEIKCSLVDPSKCYKDISCK